MSLSKPTLCLSSMPWFVKQRIVTQTDLVTRFSLSRCSKEFQKLSETSEILYHAVGLEVKVESVKLKVAKQPVEDVVDVMSSGKEGEEDDMFWIEFKDQGDDCMIQNRAKTEKVTGKNYLELAVLELMKIIGKPRAHLKALVIPISRNHCPGEDELEKLTRLLMAKFSEFEGSLAVEELEMDIELNPDDLKTTLQALKPKTLTSLTFIPKDPDQDIDEVMELEQWKQLKDVTSLGCDTIDLEQLIGFRRVLLDQVDSFFSVESFNFLIQNILQSPKNQETFECFHIQFTEEQEDSAFDEFMEQIEHATGNRKTVKFIEIPGSDWKLCIYLNDYQFLNVLKVPLNCDQHLSCVHNEIVLF